MFIEVDNTQGNYKYMVGMLQTFDAANKKLNEMVQLGFHDAFIVPYLDGVRIKREDIPSLSVNYPDLLIYLEKTGN